METNEGFRELRTTLAALNRTVILILGSIVGTVIAAIATATAA